MLCSKSEVRKYLRVNHPQVRQVGKDFWDALETRVASILERAVRQNRGHSRLTSAELLTGLYDARGWTKDTDTSPKIDKNQPGEPAKQGRET